MPRSFYAACAALLALALATSAFAQDDKVKVAPNESLFPGMTAPKLRKAAQPFRALLENSTGFSGEIVPGGDATSLADKLKKDDVQLGIFSGVEFAWAKARNDKLTPIVICVNQKRTVKACLIVNKTAKFAKPADLRGKQLSQPDEVRPHCQVYLDRKLVPAGSAAKTYFKLSPVADVEEALNDVVDGTSSGAVVDALAWASYQKSKPGAAKRLRVLTESDALPCSVIAYQSGRLTASQVKRLREGLMAAKDTQRGRDLLQQLRLTGFEAVPANYEEQLTAAAKALPAPGK